MKIYTRTGDLGQTGLFSGDRVAKTHPRIEASGEVDEVNAQLGWVRASNPTDPVDEMILCIQGDLFALGADLSSQKPETVMLKAERLAWLESAVDRMTAEIEPLRHFILPGGVPAAAALHVARAGCRRAERRMVALAEIEPVPALLLAYLNRLSDALFTMARYENHLCEVVEPRWNCPPS